MKAFPWTGAGTDGMDLRDYFAAKAMQSLVMNFESDLAWNAYEQAFIAYQIADAMMEERKEGEKE